MVGGSRSGCSNASGSNGSHHPPHGSLKKISSKKGAKASSRQKEAATQHSDPLVHCNSSKAPTYGSADYVRAGASSLKTLTDDSLDNSIDAIVLGNGGKKGGKTLIKGRWYASSKEVCNPQTYFEIDIDSFNFEVIRVEEKTPYQTVNLTCTLANLPDAFWCSSPSSKRQSTRAKEMTAGLKAFCRDWPGLAVYLGGVGSRDGNADLEKFWYFFCPTLDAAKGLLCAPNSIAHGILQLGSVREALSCLPDLFKHNHHFTSLKPVGDVIRGLGRKLNVRKPQNYGHLKRMIENKSTRHQVLTEVCSWDRGVWIVRLRSPGPYYADHCVCVDSKNGLILDGAEPFALRLSEESLRGCVGPNSSDAYVADFLEIHK